MSMNPQTAMHLIELHELAAKCNTHHINISYGNCTDSCNVFVNDKSKPIDKHNHVAFLAYLSEASAAYQLQAAISYIQNLVDAQPVVELKQVS